MSFWEGSEWQRQQEQAKKDAESERLRRRALPPEERTRLVASSPAPLPLPPTRATTLSSADLDRAEQLQELERRHGRLSPEDAAELDGLKAKARSIAASPELGDDPATLFVDESSRPLIGGGDSLAVFQKRECDEFEGIARSYLTLLGRVAFDAVVAAVLAKR